MLKWLVSLLCRGRAAYVALPFWFFFWSSRESYFSDETGTTYMMKLGLNSSSQNNQSLLPKLDYIHDETWTTFKSAWITNPCFPKLNCADNKECTCFWIVIRKCYTKLIYTSFLYKMDFGFCWLPCPASEKTILPKLLFAFGTCQNKGRRHVSYFHRGCYIAKYLPINISGF